MNTKKYQWILYFISSTIAITIVVQLYWNYNNYKTNKQRVTNDIQASLDNALEEYYAHLAKTDYWTIIKSDSLLTDGRVFKNITSYSSERNSKKQRKVGIKSIKIESDDVKNSDSSLGKIQEDLKKHLLKGIDTSSESMQKFTSFLPTGNDFYFNNLMDSGKVQVIRGQKAFDSLKVMKIIGTILISMEKDSIEYQKVDSLLALQFQQKNISPNYVLLHFKSDTLYHTSNSRLDKPLKLSVDSKSTYLKPNETITLNFENPFLDALRLSSSGIIISFLLSVAIVSCLFYLLKIINQQKQLAEVKNDLISNITHEFKTPIATISVALESIQNFNVIDDKNKTKSYVDMSREQLLKLNVMVEKLLETATLDSESLQLKKESSNIVELLRALIDKHQMQTEHNTIQFLPLGESIKACVDIFHFENAVNNILDNAIKYGGKNISVTAEQTFSDFLILISDDGDTLTKVHKDKIFEKFYRVPTGNTHDVKGFGIGLYYTKKIIEKHGGSILLDLHKNQTIFKISLPNE